MLLFTPQPHYFHQPSPRERYLRALAEEERARKAYIRDMTDQYSNSFGAGYGYNPGYDLDDLREARAREYHRQQQQRLAAVRARQLEAERLREEQYELEHRRALAARRQARAEQERHQANDFVNYLSRMMGTPERETTPTESKTSDDSTAPISIPINSPEPASNVTPTLERKQEAASKIQQTFRAYLLRRKALKTLEGIRHTLTTLQQAFVFPANPDFDSSTEDSFRLLYTSTNAPIHAYEDSLLRLLTKLDEVESGGDLIVRNTRKSLAVDVELALKDVDAQKEAAWKMAKEESMVVSDSISELDVSLEPATEEPAPEKKLVVDQTVTGTATSALDSRAPDVEMTTASVNSETDTSQVTTAEVNADADTDKPAPMLQSSVPAIDDTVTPLASSEPTTNSPSDTTSSELPTSTSKQPQLYDDHTHDPLDDTPANLAMQGLNMESLIPEDDINFSSHEGSSNNSPRLENMASPDATPSESLETPFLLARPFSPSASGSGLGSGSAAQSIVSMPVLNGFDGHDENDVDSEMKEVEGIVVVDADPKLELVNTNENEKEDGGNAEVEDEGTETCETDDFVMIP